MLQIVGVRSLDGHAEGSGPDLSGGDSESARDTEQDGVVIVLGETVVHEEGTGSTVDIGEGVLNLTSSSEDFGDDLVVGFNELNQVRSLNEFVGEVEFADETGVGLSQDGVSVSGNNLTGGHGVGDVLTDIVLGPGVSVLLDESEDVVEALLVGETVEGSSESVKTSGEGEVGIGESRSDQVGSVGRYVSTFMITVQ